MKLETRFEGVWAAGSLDGVGALRSLSRSGAWIDAAKVLPPMGARVRVVILDLEDERDSVLVDGEIVRRTASGSAIKLDPSSSSLVELLLDRIAEADPTG